MKKLRRSLIPVSYTHLDVYKRQVKMNYLIPEEIKNQILELKKTMERIKLDGLNFEYNQNPYGDVEIHIMEFK